MEDYEGNYIIKNFKYDRPDICDEDLEFWKDVKGYERLYQISNFGRVKSLGGKIMGNSAISKEKILKLSADKQGYYRVVLCLNKKHKTYKIHQLVAINFLEHTPCGYKKVIDHRDRNRLNNHIWNLRIVSPRKNSSNHDKSKTSSSKIGVCWDKQNNKWRATIQIIEKSKYLGLFDSELEASEAYQKAKKLIENI